MGRKWSGAFTFVKPDGVRRGLVGKVISRFEHKGLRLVGLKMVWPTPEIIRQNYLDKSDQPWFEELVQAISSGPIVLMVWEGHEAIQSTRQIIGLKDPLKSSPGSIRGDFALEAPYMVVHGARSVQEAEEEVKLWFFNGGQGLIHDTILGVENFVTDEAHDSADENEEEE